MLLSSHEVIIGMKRIFYYTDVLPFLSKEQAAIDKLIRNLDLFNHYADEITLVWHPWSKTVEYLQLNNSPVINDYLNLIEEYRRNGWGILDESVTLNDTRDVMLSCNAYYGDMCDLIYDAQDAGIPVMIQNTDI